MSTELSTIKNTGGSHQAPLQITQYYSGPKHGVMIQLTQGIGGHDTPGFIQLTYQDTALLLYHLEHWLVTQTSNI